MKFSLKANFCFKLLILLCLSRSEETKEDTILSDNISTNVSDFIHKKKTKAKMPRKLYDKIVTTIQKDMKENLYDNIVTNIFDFIHDAEKILPKTLKLIIDVWEDIRDICLLDFKKVEDKITNKDKNNENKCRKLGGEYAQSIFPTHRHCQFPYTMVGCFGLCAHGIDFYGGYDEKVIEEIKTAIDNRDATNKNYELTDEILENYDKMMFTDAGCTCYRKGYPRQKDSKYNTGDSIFIEVEDDIAMRFVVNLLEIKTENPKIRNAKYKLEGNERTRQLRRY